MFTTQVRHVEGLELVWVADLDLDRARAAANGAPVGSDAEALIAREEADVVIEATGSDTGMARCCELVRPAGRIVLVGVFHGMVPLPALVALQKEIVLAGSTTYGRHQGLWDNPKLFNRAFFV